MSTNGNIVVEWLRSLHLGQYAESFLDNGYDDLEICKQVGDPDLDAIGVFNQSHRSRLLQSVRTLREEGAASVYFTLEESAAIQEECKCETGSARSSRASDKEVGRSPSSNGSAHELGRYLDEYEEGKAELVRIPKRQLKLLLNEKLNQDGIRLSSHPYSTSTGERGYLEGLASRYAELFNTHYGDVMSHLEELRQRQWAELSPRMRVLSPSPTSPLARHSGLTTSHSQPIYVPGKYSPSSCLSDREEDEIYGFAGYGVYGKQMLQRQQANKLVIAPKHNYQNCLSPRSAYFYEFPPSERPNKKRTSLSRLLRHLRTNRKAKTIGPNRLPPHRVGTPDGLEPPIMMQPTDYDKIRLIQKTTANSFEETIHRLKVQEALKKKERFDREHEEILRELREGLLMSRRDDTYMYDDEMQRLGQHWYDEPPYESDPEDFLMAETAHHARVGFQLNMRAEQLVGESEVISLRSAGDITLPHQRGHLLHPSLRQANRESGDYAASDVHSVCSRLSSLSMETSRSEQLEMDVYHRLRPYNGVEPALSPGHSSDYAEQDELVTIHTTCGSATVGHRVRGLKADGKVIMGRHEHHHHPSGHHHHSHHHCHHHKRHGSHSSPDNPPTRHHSSAESLPSGSSTQALVTAGMEDSSPQGPVLALARALVDSTPNPYDTDALRFKKNDLIEVLNMSTSGLWRGRVHNRVGYFKFISVELLPEAQRRPKLHRHRPQTLEQMLTAIDMKEHMSLFVLNGYEDLESFCEIQEKDLDYLGLTDPEHRAKILAAIQVLQEFETPEEECNDGEQGSGSISGESRKEQPSSNNLGAENTENNSTSEAHDPPTPEGAVQAFLPNIPLTRAKPDCKDEEALKEIDKVSGVCENGNPGLQRNCCTLSEKSSDSGVSSSSLSSSINQNATRNKHRRNGTKPTLLESPVRTYESHFIADARKD